MERARRILKSVFGYSEFRHHQGDAIEALLQGRDVLMLMPTGGGKSLCYQVPALVREGAAIVVSPLIALMQDQVHALRLLGIRAAFLNSTLDLQQQYDIESMLQQGRLDILYVAPERLLTGRMQALLERCRVALFAIDEAHCVSQWGHDFRREYQRLYLLHERFPTVPRIALTATADSRTRIEIVEQLNLHQAAKFINSFDRPNIRYTISEAQGARARLWSFLEREHPRDAGIVYCLSRKGVEAVAQWLQARGREALPYHAGLTDELRHRHQERFLKEEGLIIVATIAFGMGIDKPDVRFVAHLNLPRSIEAYYQETGRAGRDGEPANAWMACSLKDVITLRQFVAGTEADERFKAVARQKLESMLALCELTGCRRQALLEYFGESLPGPCGNCDNCLDPPQTWDATEAARMAISCVYRTGQRFGVNYVISVLRGNDDERIRRNGHHRISTFGIGTEHGAGEWRSILRQLIARGYLDADVEGFGTLALTAKCRPLLRGEMPLALRRRTRPASPSPAPRSDSAGPADADAGLFEALRALRRRLAEAQGVPPYIVFHDRTLREMARLRPADLESLGALPGIGARKLSLYGRSFLEAIRAHSPPRDRQR